MSRIQVKNLTFSYPSSGDIIFEQVNLQIDTDWKLGFVGRNGRGKTTFLSLLRGKYPYSGTIRASVRFQYFPYPVTDVGQQTGDILKEICPRAEEWEFLREFSYLEVEPTVLWRPFAALSQGEQTKVLLAALFLNEGDFLLIDEPTNHLDARARELVSAYLQKKTGFLLVSHDRCFLDGCVDHILALNRANIEVQRGNFSSWMTNFERQQALEQGQNRRLQRDIRQLQRAAARTAGWSDRVEASKVGAADKGYVGHKAAKMMKRAKSIEARQQRAIGQKAGLLKNTETAERLLLSPLRYHADTLVSVSDIVIRYDGIPVNKPVSFVVRQGERIALDGRNGSGKSSLLKLLLGQEMEYTGGVERSSGLVVSYVPQDTSHLRGSLTTFAREHHLEESRFKAILRKMDIGRVQFTKDMRDFSNGQKKKVLLAKSLCEEAHLYVWDEPLNFIDVYSRIQIERLLNEFSPTMVFVEHDRAFREAVATEVIRLEK
ncbi:MAG: ABC-F type ribosomal protection protein [Eubacteriales bacterium]|nr:ABC-F type ribosomal protection protein [Eubacteriales bacterium]